MNIRTEDKKRRIKCMFCNEKRVFTFRAGKDMDEEHGRYIKWYFDGGWDIVQVVTEQTMTNDDRGPMVFRCPACIEAGKGKVSTRNVGPVQIEEEEIIL